MEGREPSNEDIAKMANAAMDAACDMAEELGYRRLYGIMGIERAWSASEKAMKLTVLLGPEMMVELGSAIEKAEMHDMMKEAESVLKGDE